MEEGEGFGTNFHLFFDKELVFASYLVESLFWPSFGSCVPWLVHSATGPLAPQGSHAVH